MAEQEQESPRPESFERQISPEEERKVLLNFMGNMYGESKQIDSNIIGPATTLGNQQSEKIKRQIEQVYSQQQPVQQVPVAPPVAPPPPVAPQPQVQAPPPPAPQPEVNDNQLAFDFNIDEKDELFSLLDRVLSRLDKLDKKIDNLDQNIKKIAKKKSVESKKET